MDPLFTDLYELTMGASYVAQGLDGPATFDLFVRSLPPQRRFLVACGIDEALDYLEEFHVDDDSVDYLAGLGLFDRDFLEHLRHARFTGDVWAVAEGEVVFAGEPLVEVTGPLVIAQMAETFLLNRVGAQTMVASKAARVAIAAAGRTFVDFGARRDHGHDAALRGARAAYIGGAGGTSLVSAGRDFGVPLSGTMAHSYVMCFDDERDAFRAYARQFPASAILLIDTYDTLTGARHAAEVANEVAAEGIAVQGVRLDSGDVSSLSRSVRGILDGAGLRDVKIFASGDLDEHRIAAFVRDGAPIDAYGVGTQMGTSADAPFLSVVYKLVETSAGPRMKLSAGKQSRPGAKQVARRSNGDVVGRRDETDLGGRPLLEPVIVGGRRVRPRADMTEARERRAAAVAALPPELRSLDDAVDAGAAWPVTASAALAALTAEIAAHLRSEAEPAGRSAGG